jgi:hypothetical protein
MSTRSAIKLVVVTLAMSALLFVGWELLRKGERGAAIEALATIPACVIGILLVRGRGCRRSCRAKDPGNGAPPVSGC